MNGEIIAAIATAIILSSTFPQVYKTVKTRKTDDISLNFLSICVAGQLVWTLYAINESLLIFIIGEGLDAALWGVVLFIKIYNDIGESVARYAVSEYPRMV